MTTLEAVQKFKGSPVQRDQLVTFRRSLSSIQDTKRETEHQVNQFKKTIQQLNEQIHSLSLAKSKYQQEVTNIQQVLEKTQKDCEAVKILVAKVEEVKKQADSLQKNIALKRKELLTSSRNKTSRIESEIRILENQYDSAFEVLTDLSTQLMEIGEQEETIDPETRQILIARLEELKTLIPGQENSIQRLEEEKFTLERKAQHCLRSIELHRDDIKHIQDRVYNYERGSPVNFTPEKWELFQEEAPQTTLKYCDEPPSPQDSVMYSAPYSLSPSTLEFKLKKIPTTQTGNFLRNTEEHELTQRISGLKKRLQEKEMRYTYKLAQLNELTTNKSRELKSLIDQYESQVNAIEYTQKSEPNEPNEFLQCLNQVALYLGIQPQSQQDLVTQISQKLHILTSDLQKAKRFKKNKEKFIALYTHNTTNFEEKLDRSHTKERLKAELLDLQQKNKELEKLLAVQTKIQSKKDTNPFQYVSLELQQAKERFCSDIDELNTKLKHLQEQVAEQKLLKAEGKQVLALLQKDIQLKAQAKEQAEEECQQLQADLTALKDQRQYFDELVGEITRKQEEKELLEQEIEVFQEKTRIFSLSISQLEEKHAAYSTKRETLSKKIKALKDKHKSYCRHIDSLRFTKAQEIQESTEELEALREMIKSSEETLRELVQTTEKYRQAYLEYKSKSTLVKTPISKPRKRQPKSPDDSAFRVTRLEEGLF